MAGTLAITPFVEFLGAFSEEANPLGGNPQIEGGSFKIVLIIQTGIVLLIIYSWYAFLRDWFFAYYLPPSRERDEFTLALTAQLLFAIFSTFVGILAILIVRLF